MVTNSLYLKEIDHGNFVLLTLFRLQKLHYSHKSGYFHFAIFIYFKKFFTVQVVTRMPFGFRCCPIQLVTCHQIPSCDNEYDYFNNRSSVNVRFKMCSFFVKLSSPSPNVLCLSISKAVITILEIEREKMIYIEANSKKNQQSRSILTTAGSNFIRFLCDCFVNDFLESVPAVRSFIESQKMTFEKSFDPMFSIQEKRKYLANNISLVKLIGKLGYIFI